jgi:hypothetical protein
MAGIRERDKQAVAILASTVCRNLVPPLFYVRNMFFSEVRAGGLIGQSFVACFGFM